MCTEHFGYELGVDNLIRPTRSKDSHFIDEEAEPQRVFCGDFTNKRWDGI